MLDYYLQRSLGAAQIKITKPGIEVACAAPLPGTVQQSG